MASPTEKIANVCDCSEGLENAFKKAAESHQSLVESLTSPRYTSARIRRIALQNFLQIDKAFIIESLNNPLYLRILALKKSQKNLLSALSQSSFPIIARPRDENKLLEVTRRCFDVDVFAEKVYKLLYPAQKAIDVFIP